MLIALSIWTALALPTLFILKRIGDRNAFIDEQSDILLTSLRTLD